MVTLNVGCGRDRWGDIRLDLQRSQTGVYNNPTIIASGLYLPLRSGVISEIRCFHVLEHVANWRGLLQEIARVGNGETRLQLRFPLDDGFKRDFLISWSRLDLGGMRHAYLTREKRAHVWTIDPNVVSTTLEEFGIRVVATRNRRQLFYPAWLMLPRWRKFLPRMLRVTRVGSFVRKSCVHFPELDYEWALDGTRNQP